MKKVTLFKVVTEELMVASHAEHVQIHSIPFEACTPVRGSGGDELAFSPSYKVHTLPIRKHMRRTELSPEYLALTGTHPNDPTESFTTEETYIAIDPAAERVLDVEHSHIQSLNTQINSLNHDCARYRNQIEGYETNHDRVANAGFFTRLKWLFTGVQDV